MSSPIATVTSISVDAGSTIVTPARPWLVVDAALRDRADLGELDAIVDAAGLVGVGEAMGCDRVACVPERRQDVGEVELLLGVVGRELLQGAS